MPVIKSAKKKLRKDKKITAQNDKVKNLFKKVVKNAIKKPTEASVKTAYVAIDKATKKKIIHKNKASRIKSKLTKLMSGKLQAVKQTKPIKKQKAKLVKNKAKK